jgi:hypothetical protein
VSLPGYREEREGGRDGKWRDREPLCERERRMEEGGKEKGSWRNRHRQQIEQRSLSALEALVRILLIGNRFSSCVE